MKGFLGVVVFVAVWTAGCFVFDLIFGLHGAWLMLAGAATFTLAGWAAQRVNKEAA